MQIRYAKHLPSVLKNINCTFPRRKKVGVVGRAGSGKSTLTQAIFRIVEPKKGSIIIDDVDICKIGLHDLRSRLSIIPQDPAMFEGTVRTNLDPLQQYSDREIWEVKISYQTPPFIVKLIVSIQLITPLVKRSRRVVDEYKPYVPLFMFY